MSSSQASEDKPVSALSSQINTAIQGKQIIEQGERLIQSMGIRRTQIFQKKNRSKRTPQVDVNSEKCDEELSPHIRGKIWTSVCTGIKHHLQDHSVAIVVGAAGEGKTTLAHLLLNDFKQQRWNITIPQTPKEYFELEQRGKTIFLFDEIFGTFEFVDSSMKAWIKVFDDLRNRLDKQTSKTFGSACTSLKIIFVQRDYIWKEAEPKLGKYRNNLFKEENVCNVTISQTLNKEDKLQLMGAYEKEYQYILSKNDKQKLLTANIPHGFPLCCKMVFLSSGAFQKALDFSLNPVTFLNESMMRFCHDDLKRIVLCVLLKNGGKVELKVIRSKQLMESELESIGLLGSPSLSIERFHLIKNVFQSFDGRYVIFGHTFVEFSHASILQSAVVSVWTEDPEFVLRYCSIGFLKDQLRLKTEENASLAIPQTQYIFTDARYMGLIAERFISEMCQGELSCVLSCKLIDNEIFVKCLLDNLPSNSNLFTVKDMMTGHSCFYLASQTGNNVFLKELISRTKLNRKYIQDAVFGCCEFGNTEGLKKLLTIKKYLYMLSKRNDQKETPFLSAAKNGHTEICQLLLLHDINVDAQDTTGNTALHFAAEGGNTDLVGILIQKSCRLDMENQNMQTALHLCLLGGHSETAEVLLSHGADYMLKDGMGRTAMHCASSTGLNEIVKYLIEKGSDTKSLDNQGSSPLLNAAEGGYTEIVQVLHEHCGSINQTNFKGYTAFHWACRNGHLEVVQLLIELGCDVNIQSKTGESGLMLASWRGRQDVVELLIQKYCRLDLKDGLGRTAILYAIEGLQENTASRLLESGCRLDVTITMSLKRSWDAYCCNLDGIERFLIKVVAPVHIYLDILYGTKSYDGREVQCLVLLFAICSGSIGLVTAILDRWPDNGGSVQPIKMLHTVVSSCSSYSDDVLNFTPGKFMSGNVDQSKFAPMAAELIRRGADVDSEDDDGVTILHDAAAAGRVDVMDVLLQARCTIDKKDKHGQTPLHYASWYGQMEAVQWLLEKNADPHIVDTRYHTALHYAILGKHQDVVQVLESEGCSVSTPVQLLYSVPYLREAWQIRSALTFVSVMSVVTCLWIISLFFLGDEWRLPLCSVLLFVLVYVCFLPPFSILYSLCILPSLREFMHFDRLPAMTHIKALTLSGTALAYLWSFLMIAGKLFPEYENSGHEIAPDGSIPNHESYVLVSDSSNKS